MSDQHDSDVEFFELDVHNLAPEGTRVYALLERSDGRVLTVNGALPCVRMGQLQHGPLLSMLVELRNKTGILVDYAGCCRGMTGGALYWNAVVRVLGEVVSDFHPERVTVAQGVEVARLSFELVHYVRGECMVFKAHVRNDPRPEKGSPAYEELNGFPLTEADVDAMVGRRESLGHSIFRGHDVQWRQPGRAWPEHLSLDQEVLMAVQMKKNHPTFRASGFVRVGE